MLTWNIEEATGYQPKTTFYKDLRMERTQLKTPIREPSMNGRTTLYT